jgi:iron complex transport system ATP-binding protein
MPQPLIELDRVAYRQSAAEILADVSWRLDPGDRWALLGPNGCGKTTLLRIACGYLWPSAGVVRRLGQELVDLSELRRSIGWVAADLAPQIPPDELAIETVVSGKFAQIGLRRWAHGMSDAEPSPQDFNRAYALLESMGCESLAEKPFGVLSQGERQQTLVARARMVDPLLIVLDEPCAGMDPGVRERFLAWLGEVASATGRAALDSPSHAAPPAIVFVTHHVEEIMPAFDRTLLMHSGRIRAAGPTAEVITPQALAETYGVAIDRIERAAGRLWPIWSPA